MHGWVKDKSPPPPPPCFKKARPPLIYIISSGNQILLKELQLGTFVDLTIEQSIFERYPTQRVSLLERFSTVGGLYRKKDVQPRRVSTLQIWVSVSSLPLLEDNNNAEVHPGRLYTLESCIIYWCPI